MILKAESQDRVTRRVVMQRFVVSTPQVLSMTGPNCVHSKSGS
jgi:hypothetical protein